MGSRWLLDAGTTGRPLWLDGNALRTQAHRYGSEDYRGPCDVVDDGYITAQRIRDVGARTVRRRGDGARPAPYRQVNDLAARIVQHRQGLRVCIHDEHPRAQLGDRHAPRPPLSSERL